MTSYGLEDPYRYPPRGAEEHNPKDAAVRPYKRRQVAYRTWNRNNLLSVSTGIEKKGNVLVESVFLRMHDGYRQDRYIAMQMDCMDLRAFSHACKEAVFQGASGYKKFTDPSKSGGRGDKKSLSVAASGGLCYVNLQQGELRYAASFAPQELLALADQLTLMAEMTEKALYGAQRGEAHG